MYDYYYKRHFNESTTIEDEMIKDITIKLRNWIQFIDADTFYDNGEVKGCYLEDSIVLSLKDWSIQDDEVYDSMKKYLISHVTLDRFDEK